MATTADTDDITVAEYDRLEEYIFGQLRDGKELFHLEQLAENAEISDGKVYEAMGMLIRKNDYVSNVGAGIWQIELPDGE